MPGPAQLGRAGSRRREESRGQRGRGGEVEGEVRRLCSLLSSPPRGLEEISRGDEGRRREVEGRGGEARRASELSISIAGRERRTRRKEVGGKRWEVVDRFLTGSICARRWRGSCDAVQVSGRGVRRASDRRAASGTVGRSEQSVRDLGMAVA